MKEFYLNKDVEKTVNEQRQILSSLDNNGLMLFVMSAILRHQQDLTVDQMALVHELQKRVSFH